MSTKLEDLKLEYEEKVKKKSPILRRLIKIFLNAFSLAYSLRG